jgi:hypothetical protein
MQITKTLIATLALALAGHVGIAAAQTADDMSFSGNFKMDRIDRNKDGMVSKAEFLEAMGKVWDMKMKEMKIKGDKASADEMKQILMYLKAGG